MYGTVVHGDPALLGIPIWFSVLCTRTGPAGHSGRRSRRNYSNRSNRNCLELALALKFVQGWLIFAVPPRVWPTFQRGSRGGTPINPILFWNFEQISCHFQRQKIWFRLRRTPFRALNSTTNLMCDRLRSYKTRLTSSSKMSLRGDDCIDRNTIRDNIVGSLLFLRQPIWTGILT